MRATLTICSLLVLVLVGCGQKDGQADKYVGTWRMESGDHVRLVVTADGGAYRIVQGVPGAERYTPLAVFRLSGDELVGKAPSPADPNAPQDEYRLRLSDKQGQLSFAWTSQALTKPFRTTLTKLSDSTATPVPVP